jgi:hypothetical protein
LSHALWHIPNNCLIIQHTHKANREQPHQHPAAGHRQNPPAGTLHLSPQGEPVNDAESNANSNGRCNPAQRKGFTLAFADARNELFRQTPPELAMMKA